ncbi:MAG: minC [Myxococcaceae bacterium]|nr:minC [Myxococcaceae bacterium]
MATMARDVTPFELEGMVSTVSVLRLSTTDLALVKRELRSKLEQLPGFFLDAPIVVDLSTLEGTDDDPDFDPRDRLEVPLRELSAMLRELKVVPIGIRNLREERRAEARAAGFGVIRGGGKPRKSSRESAHGGAQTGHEAPQQDRRSEALSQGSLILRTPLRSGQVVYAEQCDAVVLAPVNAGAEIIADGNIHIYATLRGRALAGAHGNEDARIFCRSLEADLVAIAGCYLRADEIPAKTRGKPAQIYLENGNLVVAEL